MPVVPPLRPEAYAPYRDPRDYILSWTDVIWVERGIGRLSEHYGPDVRVHSAYGETYDFDSVISNSVQKFAAFPNSGGGHGEDVIWEQRGPNGFISSHRILKTGTHTGFWTYGPPTGRDWMSRTVAHCLVQDNKIVEEWLVRDEFAVLQHLGLDPFQVAADLAAASPVTGQALCPGPDTGAFAGRVSDPVASGVSGERPAQHEDACRMILDMFETIWNQRRFDLAGRYCHEGVVCNTVRLRRVQSLDAYKVEIINLLATFPDAKIEVRDIVVQESPELGLRIAAIWVLRGTYSGVPTYGPVTRTPVSILGATHFELRDDKVLREFRIYDEVAAIAQIIAGRQKNR